MNTPVIPVILPTEEQADKLRQAGWRGDSGKYRYCRICHRIAMYDTWGWGSPNYTFYHKGCVMSSPMARKAMR